jgi:chemotaxis protein CheC
MSSVAVGSWAELVSRGTDNAMSGLSQMVGSEISVNAFGLRRVPVAEISNIVGGPDTMAVGIYLTVSGSADGHLMLMYDPKIATAFVDLLMMQEVGTTQELGEMEHSALGEMGNIIGAFFLNALADETGLDLHPSPPSVMTDMAGALLDVITADILLTADETYLVETTFAVEGQEISGVFFVIPSENLLRALVEAGTEAA